MERFHAAITAVGGYVPEGVLTNADIEKLIDTTDEWITTRVGIKERRILRDKDKGASYLGIQAVKDMFARNDIDPKSIEMVICSTNTGDYHFPTTASIIAHETGITSAYCFDVQAACTGFVVTLEMAANYIMSGRYKKVLVVCTEKMSAAVDYTDRATTPLFGDGSGCVLVEPNTEGYGVIDSIIRNDGEGKEHLIMKAGGSACPATHDTVDQKLHYVYQEGQYVFKAAVSMMGDTSAEVLQRNGLNHDNIAWVFPHQANLRIIDAVARRMNLSMDKVAINIQKYGNTSSASIPLCLWEWEDKLRKGDNLILTAFGAGYIWGAVYVKWAYDGKK